ncbi:hypothetical protein ACOMHN_031570 [Nucella lapillus]
MYPQTGSEHFCDHGQSARYHRFIGWAGGHTCMGDNSGGPSRKMAVGVILIYHLAVSRGPRAPRVRSLMEVLSQLSPPDVRLRPFV